MGTETAKHAPSIEATTAALAGLGFLVAAQGKPFDLIALGNACALDPVRTGELAGAGWLGVVVDPALHGFDHADLRAVARDCGGRAVFAVLEDGAVRFNGGTDGAL